MTAAMIYYTVGAAGALIGAVMWLAMLQIRIADASRDAKETERRIQAHERLCGERYVNIERQHEEVRAWMTRLEAKIDTLMQRR